MDGTKYTVVFEREADGGFVVSVLALPGCVSQGATREEALANIREAIEVYMEACVQRGDPVPEQADTAIDQSAPAPGPRYVWNREEIYDRFG